MTVSVDPFSPAQKDMVVRYLIVRKRCQHHRIQTGLCALLTLVAYWLTPTFPGQWHLAWLDGFQDWMLKIGSTLSLVSFAVLYWLERSARTALHKQGLPPALIRSLSTIDLARLFKSPDE